ncbi:UNVERIFIED_CONTAM: CBL-interacting serine/threonine-protein kinase [Sesamum latifolium]|uniref:non-specific serine/threonine protein kinase n=1 Tax=Sesamum latifolium TaxID=2727402 RepID=A0AAW2VT76_9LAMI
MVVRKVGKYEVGRTIGEGTFAKVKFAQNTETGESVAMKVLDRSTIIKHKMVDQIKREISIMKRVRHPYVVRLHEVHHGRLSESESRRYFQQLIDGVDYCHSKGVYHRDLKGVSLLRTTCGTPNYVAPEVLSHKGYNGALADIWSCGVILYVLMAGYLPFDEIDLTTLYGKIENAEFSSWFPVGARSLIHRILDPNPETLLVLNSLPVGNNLVQRIRIEEIRNDEWFKKNYNPVRLPETEDIDLMLMLLLMIQRSVEFNSILVFLDDGYIDNAPRKTSSFICIKGNMEERLEELPTEQCGSDDMGPLVLNAFDLIILSQGLNLSALFDRRKDSLKHQTRFVSQRPAKVVLSSMEVVAQSMGFKTHIRNYKMRVEGLSANRTSHFSVIVEIFQVAPTFIMVDIQKAAGDAEEFLKFYNNFCNNLDDIIWKPPDEMPKSRIAKTKSRKR